MSRFIPIGQKRLTNVAVVRYRTHGKRFEIACYRNTVIAYRDGAERDIDEVLHSHTVYENVDKGVLAKRDDLLKCFGTDDQTQICTLILKKGDFQVSEQERNAQLDAIFRDVATRVADMSLDPHSRRPYPLTTIERTLRDELHFAPNLTRSTKQQALHAMRQLQASGALPIMRAQMSLRLIVAPERRGEAEAALLALVSEEMPVGTSTFSQPLTLSAKRDDAAGTLDFAADPSLYRPIVELSGALAGTLQILELKTTEAEGGGSEAVAGVAAAGGGGARKPAARVDTSVERSATASAAPRRSAAGSAGAEQDASSTVRGGGGGGAGAGEASAAERRAARMFKLNLRSAENGDPVAQLEVGKAYASGAGVECDVSLARKWLEEARGQGVTSAASHLEALAGST